VDRWKKEQASQPKLTKGRIGGQARNLEQVGTLGRGKPSSTTNKSLRVDAGNDSDGFCVRLRAEGA